MVGGKVKLELFAPTLHDLTAKPVHARISQHKVEFNDVSFTDFNGDLIDVLPSKIDIKGSHVTYKVIAGWSGYFMDVDDHGGFNGYVLTFASLGGGKTLRSAQIVAKHTTIDIEKSDVFVSKNALHVNVDGLYYEHNDTIDIKLSFKVRGNNHANQLSGDDGDDLIVGGNGDTLRGRGGADTFEFTANARSATISDFDAAQGDRIDLSRLDAGHNRAGGQHFRFIGDGAFSGTDGAEIRIRHVAGDLYKVRADTDGDGRGDLSIDIHSSGTLSAGDFDF